MKIAIGKAQVCIAIGLLCFYPSAQAATSTSTMAVSATVLSTCTVAALPLVLGNYTGSAVTATSTITAICTNSTAYNIGIDPGSAPSATVTTRQMSFGSNRLGYGLFRDAALTENWGQTAGTDTVSGTGSGLPQLVTVYGQIPANELVSPGAYLDTVTVTLTY